MIIRLAILSILLLLGCSTTEKVVSATFTNKMTMDDLIEVRADLSKKGISLEYTTIKFNENARLTDLSITADCNDGFSGTGTIEEFSNMKTLSFTRDYRDVQSPFYIEVGQVGQRK